MKKLLLLLPIIGLFILTSCVNDTEDTTESSTTEAYDDGIS